MDNTKIVVIEEQNDIIDFLNNLESKYKGVRRRLNSIMQRISLPLSIVIEPHYVDKLHRDTYYSYYSNKHFNYDRNCQRLAIFQGEIVLDDFYDSKKHEMLNNVLIGTIVLRPLYLRPIGRTLLNPYKLSNIKSYVRTTIFDVEILGNIFQVEAFPFLSQDSEVMTCAETTVWNILEYYGIRYPEYKSILPQDMINKLESFSNERVLPSIGLDYFKVAKLLKAFSFAPKLYAAKSYSPQELKRLFHYYVESGIPLAVGVQGHQANGSVARHSVICIGHATERSDLNHVTIQHHREVDYIDTSQLYDKYVMIDDNQIPYMVENFNDLTLYSKSSVTVFVAPLYKRIFLDAEDANTVIYELIDKLRIWDFIKNNTSDISNKNPIVIRLFLTSSRKYKNYRVHHTQPDALKEEYSNIQFPKFLWVAEISTYDLYINNKILGEIVIDATSNCIDMENSIILIRYKYLWGYRNPYDTFSHLIKNIIPYKDMNTPYDMYYNNLKEASL